MSMSRDGLLPKAFSRVHPKYHTPGFATIITGLLVGIPIFFIDMDTVVDLCSIGTLFAFVLVCGGVLMLQKHPELPRRFRVPFINGKWIVPTTYILTMLYLAISQKQWLHESVNPLSGIDSVPMFIFFIVFAVLAVFSFLNNLSLIPVAGIITCLYLMAQIHVKNWLGFTLWLIAGLIIYFTYSYKNSKLHRKNE
jgi:amino acid transporter